ncbi:MULTISPECIES: Pepco domain-containing protein [Klebsiella]|nr:MULTISPECIES: hypothetical protein [Klebsiella]EBR5126741.1 hypothetical protein [Salmonella enterica]EBV1907181.1 hypothetical protein [Salmonella enterica subsp. enterica serovar Kande]EHN2717712.1 hypothetical protein [Salmonella enterica subsp. enterica serovar Essen]VEA58022.1 Uncharacterised protein [Salmonella enterica subsp. enterica]EBR5129792.1 hypothetical protein [Salmonella enterica]
MDKIKVWVGDDQDTNTKAALPSFTRGAVGKSVELSGAALKESVKGFAEQFSDLLDGNPFGKEGVVIDEIELSLAVTASGGIELLGKATVGSQASIKLKLKRKA